MNYWDKKLMRDQLDKQLSGLSVLLPFNFQRGFIKPLREALGMTTKQLAERMGIVQSRIVKIEQGELEGNLKLVTMEKVADALGMKFVYGFVPQNSLDDMVRNQAKKLALKRLARLDHTMSLEDQNLSNTEKEKALEDMIDKVLIEGDKELWNVT